MKKFKTDRDRHSETEIQTDGDRENQTYKKDSARVHECTSDNESE